ncbi:Disease resistance protein [Melia azedarach]|uniref:Disease resistance protein n=1 Tax=Melia azedarach TaxID=155640 RepID=A0ACC1YEA0_MELAZ|nr:Disease resistance protein [Melia azedarach]
MAEIIVSIAIEVVKCLAPSAERRIGYLREYKSNFEKLEAEVEKLKTNRTSIQQRVDAAKRNVEEIEENVQKWLERADEIDKNAQELLQRAGKKVIPSDSAAGAAAGRSREDEEETAARKRCFKGLCPDLKTRNQLSKEAVALLKDVGEHLEVGKFDRVSHPVILKDPQLYIKDYEAFASRASLLTEVISSLKDADVNIVGIWGMGGIGKTTLAKAVANHPQTSKFFDPVIFVEVTEKPDNMQIQRRIGERLLDLQLSEQETESNRAAKLCERLKQEKSILIILDNIWDRLDLRAIGIPCKEEAKGCKLLLTSRDFDVLSTKMDSQCYFLVGFLNDAETWNLFQKMSGRDYNEGSELESVARKVANKCAHLPILIVTVARALSNKPLFMWKDFLQQMGLTSSKDVRGIHASIELSYKYLESELLQKTLLLIRYANLTSIDELLMYGVSLGLFDDIKEMEGRRARVQTLVQLLKNSCLLLDGNTTGEHFSMHDVVRDVILNIASRDQRAFTNERVAELKWPDESTLNAYPSVVLKDVKPGELPPVLECQHLKLLSISATDPGFRPVSYSSLNIGNDFFTRLTELKVLVLANMDLSSLPESICFLSNLQALGLYNCKLDVVAIPKELTKLELLSLRNTEVKRLSAEVHHLIRLKSLDLRCTDVEVIPPNVISSLSTLEELYMDDRFEWEKQGLNKARKNASLSELKDLSKLTCVEITIKDADSLPRDLSLQMLERYKITIASQNDRRREYDGRDSCRKFKLSLTDTNICLNDGHIMQLKGIRDLRLAGLQDMKSVLYELDRSGFPQLKYLQVKDNDNLLCIVDSMEHVTLNVFPILESLLLDNLVNLGKICRRQLTAAESSFSQLRKIEVKKCHKLDNIFLPSIVRRLQLLESIEVSDCKNMKCVFGIEGGDECRNNSEVTENIKLSKLRSLKLKRLPKLRSFYSKLKIPSQQRRDEIICEDDVSVSHILFIEEVSLPDLQILKLGGIDVQTIWQNQVAAVSSGVKNLTSLTIHGCNSLTCLFSSSIASNFIRLQNLDIFRCQALQKIVVLDEGDCIEFSSLIELTIKECPKLMQFVGESTNTDHLKEITLAFFNEKVALPNLENLKLEDCNSLQCLFSSSVAKSFVRLRCLEISECLVLEVIFDMEGLSNLENLELEDLSSSSTINRLVFPRVVSLILYNLPKFKMFCPGVYTTEWPELKKLKVSEWEIAMNILKSNKDGLPHILLEKVSPKLEELTVKEKDIAAILQFSEDFFCKLKYLKVILDESKVITSADFFHSFHNMKMLLMSGISDTFSEKEVENGMSVQILNLNARSDLKHIWKEAADVDHLVHLKVWFCQNLINNLLPSSACFRNLTTLQVWGCEGLTNIVTSSTAQSLVQLREMTIVICTMLTEVVAGDEGDDHEAKDYEIVFSQLKKLHLSSLESLTSFCSANYTLQFPSLENLVVQDCRRMKSFSRGELNTPELQRVEYFIRHFDRCYWKGDLNTTIRELHEESLKKIR